MQDLLKLESVYGGYYRQDVIKNVSLRVCRQDFTGIIGPNGSGKTTLLRLATRVLLPRSGRILLEGRDIFEMGLKSFCRKVAFVSQDISTSFPYSVMELVLMGRMPYLKRLQLETKKDYDIASSALSMTDSLELRDKRIDELSAGERQRVAIARALAQGPELLFLDEPTSHLDIGHQIQIMELLRGLNRSKAVTVVMVLHDLNLASAYCDRIVLFDQGSVFREGIPEEVLTYQNIESVYRTIVLVNDNPVTHRPNVILVPGKGR